MPLHLLGLATDPGQVGDLCGYTFPHYASAGVQITLACLDAANWSGDESRRRVAALGVHDLLLFDYAADELNGEGARDALFDLLTGLRPHVVVTSADSAALQATVSLAFNRARYRAGTSALPAKLYFRGPSVTAPSVTTVVSTAGGSERFVRAYPQAWVTGVVERDLFAGVRSVVSAADEEHRAA